MEFTIALPKVAEFGALLIGALLPGWVIYAIVRFVSKKLAPASALTVLSACIVSSLLFFGLTRLGDRDWKLATALSVSVFLWFMRDLVRLYRATAAGSGVSSGSSSPSDIAPGLK